jgi:polysaccharide export outer membrane protein
MVTEMFKLCFTVALLAVSAVAQTATGPEGSPRGTYVLGPDDVITVRVTDAEEFSDKPIRIGSNGNITLPMVGRVQATGRTADDLEKDITARLKTFIRNPEVAVSVSEHRSQPVSVFGAVNTPGVHQLQGRKTLVEMLALAGGTRPDAGYSVKITREKQWGPIPLPNATTDPTGQYSVAEVDLKRITEAKNPAENILIMPNDVISVPRGEMVYVIGDVKRSGGFVLSEKAHMSVLQALSMAAGLEKTASSSNARILRASNSPDAKRTEIPVNLKKVLEGIDEDVAMQPEDILLVPGSRSKVALIRGLEAALQIGSGIAIYRGY